MKFISAIRKPFRYEFWNAAYIIIGINLLVFLLTYDNLELTKRLSLNPLLVLKAGMVWQIFTYQFVHADISHIFFNMLGIFFFGTGVERRMGSKEFLLLYLLAGTLCGALSLAVYVLTNTWYVFLMGASGAVFAILFAYAVLFPRNVIYIWGILPLPAPVLVGLYAVLELFNLVSGASQGVAHGTHLIGFAVAWLYFKVRIGISPLKVWKR